MSPLPTRPLGSSTIDVSRLSLGSWRTFERLERDEAQAVLAHALERGVTFLDDARYDDETGTAPVRTGWSEVLFGELFRAVGADRDAVVVSNKLWWEFWPREDAVTELSGSLRRMGFERLDVLYSSTLPETVAVAVCVEQIARVLDTGLVGAWAVVNWSAEHLGQAVAECERAGIAAPCAAQLPYSLGRTQWVEDPAMEAALEAAGASLVASHALAGGALSGKYAAGGAVSGRLTDAERARGRYQEALRIGAALRPVAQRLETTPAALAIAFSLAHPRTATTLVGATAPAQLDELLEALDLVERLDADDLQELRAL